MNYSRLIFGSALCFTLSASSAFAGLCKDWAPPELVGTLDIHIQESSGLAASKAYPDHLYHINDSGSKGEFFVTNRTGQMIEKVTINGFKPMDTEDMSVGPCGNDTCLFIADMGDNYHIRSYATIIAIREQQSFGGQANILATFHVKYPDKIKHNAEAMAIHPNGDLVIVSKDFNDKDKMTDTAKVFHLPAAKLWQDKDSTQTMQALGSIDVAEILNDYTQNSLVTSMDFSPDGSRFSLLSYSKVLEFDFDLSKGVKPDLSAADYTVLPTLQLRQQESMIYLPDQDAILYSTEAKDAPLYQIRCHQRL